MSTHNRAALEIVASLNAVLPAGKQLDSADAKFFEAVLVTAIGDERFRAAAAGTLDEFCGRVGGLVPSVMREVLDRQEALANRFWTSDAFRAVVEGALCADVYRDARAGR